MPERPPPRTNRSWGRYLLGCLLIGGGGMFFCCFGCGISSYWWFTDDDGVSPVGLAEARAASPSQLTPGDYSADGPAPDPPPGVMNLVHYTSPVGPLVAYVTPDPGDGKRHPAVVWAHGGFGGVSTAEWDGPGEAGPFRDAGLIVMCPSWRGENDNPGNYEMFYGEVDDALAAVKYLAGLPYVDPTRIYMVGHSTGGTVTLLATAMTGNQLRAGFSLGGQVDMWDIFKVGALPYPEIPFNWHNRRERRLRSAIDYVEHLKTPTWWFEGEEVTQFASAPHRMEKRAKAAGTPFVAHSVGGGDHFTIVQPIGKLIAKKILADQGLKCGITISAPEVAAAFAGR